MSEAKLRLLKEWLEDNNVSDFTSQLTELGPPITNGSFGQVYRRTVVTNGGETMVAVKKFLIDYKTAMAKIEKGIGQRELKVWLKLRHSTIVPLLGIAFLDHPFPALVSEWMPSGTLYDYLGNQATTLTAPARADLVKGVADGLNYLHSENVVHGDLHPGNVLIDGSGKPCLTDFGLATVEGDAELQLTTMTANQNPRWHAPEVIGIEIDREPGRPTFKSDIYSFGSVMFFIVSGDMPWQEKRYSQIIIELSRGVFPMRPGNMRDNRWNLVQECWSWDPEDRPGCAEVLKRMDSCALEEYRGRPRNVVLYGENWSGQLSLINLIMGREAAITSHTSYDVMISGQYFRLWDTLGLDEGLEGTVPAAKTEKNLTAFLRGIDQEDGVHLLIYCVHGARAIGALQTNYKIFSSVIAGSKVPTVIVATCLEYFRGDMSAWWNRNEDTLARYGMQFSGYACVTTLRDDPAESLDIHERRAQSYKDICELILNKCLQAPP